MGAAPEAGRRFGVRLVAAAGRFGRLLVVISAATVVGSLLLGLLAGASAARAISLGFYLVGCFLLVGGFFVGNRGPARLKSGDAGEDGGPFGVGSRRRLRWATAEESEDALSTSALFIVLGLALIVIGAVADSRHQLI